MKNNDLEKLIMLEEEIGELDFTGSLDESGFSNDFMDFDDDEDDLVNDFLYGGESNSNDYLITY
tara:strand:+ start:1367 stop:1558 length:192 start_codon:yes stop_codon:yes gene_type:complete